MKHIKNIIFDLGGVIINLDTDLAIREFNRLSSVPFETLYNQKSQNELFNSFDRGEITDYEFFKELRRQLRFTGPDEDLFLAWNSMLLGVPENRLDVLINAKQNYTTCLLSNTNEVHIASFEKDLYLTHGVKNFNDYFDRVYYSCRLGMRKPEKKIFEYVLEQNRLKPEETTFIDDSIEHVRSAGECGINAYLLRPGMELGDLLTQLRLL